MQDSNMLGYLSKDTKRNGVTEFANDTIHGTDYSSYSGSIVQQYVNNYKEKLKELGINVISATIPSISDLTKFKCSTTNGDCSGGPKFIYSTSYWTQTSHTMFNVWVIDTNGSVLDKSYKVNATSGVRPVIKIALSDL